MTQADVITAIKTLDKMKSQPMPIPLSYKLYKLRKSLQCHWDWQVEQEMELMQKLSEKTENGLVIKAEKRAEFDSALSAIVSTNVERDWVPVTINTNCEINMSIADLEALDGFVRIGVEDE